MLHLARETLAYGSTIVLRDVDFALSAGERVVLLGRSGAGKSTLLMAAHRRLAQTLPDVALVPQEHGLVPQLCVTRNVYMGRLDRHSALYNLANFARPFASQRRAMAPALQAVGLVDFAGASVESLSGGQKQRTALARAFFRGGPALLGDEPLSAVDEQQAGALADEMVARFPTLLLSLHDVALARRVATRIVGIADGRIRFDRATADLTDRDLHALYAA